MMVLPTSDYSEIVLYVIYRRAIVDGYTISSEQDVNALMGELSNPPQIRLALNSLLKRELIEDPHSLSQPSYEIKYFMINDEGIKLVEERLYSEDASFIALFRDGAIEAFIDDYIDVTGETLPPDAPASDRFVTLDHNSAEYVEIDSELLALDTALHQGNDLGELTEQEVAAARGELSSLRLLLKGAVVRAESVWDQASKLLLWITKKAGGTVVSELAKKALEAVVKLVGI